MLSRSLRIYDREFKRDAYLALGVKEVWLVDPGTEIAEVSCKKGAFATLTDVVRWSVPTLEKIVNNDVRLLFAGCGVRTKRSHNATGIALNAWTLTHGVCPLP